MNTLKAQGISKQYKKKRVVDNCSIDLKSSEIVGLLGPNGAGKTTCFYLIAGLIRPNQGRVFFNEKDITYFSISKRSQMGIGYLPQDVSIFRKLSVEENIKAVLELNKNLNKTQREDRLNQLIDEFNIHHIKDQFGSSLSGGECRRVEIARVMALSPKFIMLDEPFAGVDPISVVEIQKTIEQIREKLQAGILITDHNIKETLSICDRAYILSKGKILTEGSPKKILKNKSVRAEYLGKQFQLG